MKAVHYLSVLVWGMVLIAVSACAIVDFPTATPDNSPPAIAITPEFETLILEGSCVESPELLENWLGNTTAKRINLEAIMAGAADKSPDDLRPDLNRVTLMYRSLSELIAPDCTEQAHRLLAETLAITKAVFEQYVDGNLASLDAEVDGITDRLERVKSLQEGLQVNFEPPPTD